jgi:hypothetical protein
VNGQQALDALLTGDYSDVQPFLDGQRRAEQLLVILRAVCCTGAELKRAIECCPPDQLEGFARTLQKALEGRH